MASITGTSGNDTIAGTTAAETIFGGDGNDTITGLAGNDTIYGGKGTDTAKFSGAYSDYKITALYETQNFLTGVLTGYQVTGTDGTDMISSDVEYLYFNGEASTYGLSGGVATNTVTASVDTTAPTVSTFTPASSTVAAVTDNIVITFSETIVKGAGNVTLTTAAGTTVGTYDISSSSNLTLVGSTLTLNPSADLSYGTSYTVALASGLVKDATGNSFVSSSSYTFSTSSATVGTSVTYTSGNDAVSGTTGNDTIDTGAGVDKVIYSGAKSAYTIVNNTSSVTVSSGVDGIDTLKNVERLKFSDVTVALDIDGTGGQCYRIYKAAFARTPDSVGLGYWISVMDGGTSLKSVGGGFIGSDEFKSVYGTNPTNDALVTKFYTNVLGRAPDADGAAYWTGILNNKYDTVANVLANISESAENKASLVGLIGNGFEYTPYG